MLTTGFMFDKPVRKKKKNHSIRNKRRTKRGMVLDLDKVARREIVVERDQNRCQRCRVVEGDWDAQLGRYVVIQWCHVHTRDWYCVRWDENNSFAGCDRCHKWFDNHKVLGFDWYAKQFPERWAQLVNFLQTGKTHTTDADIRELWLERCGETGGLNEKC